MVTPRLDQSPSKLFGIAYLLAVLSRVPGHQSFAYCVYDHEVQGSTVLLTALLRCRALRLSTVHGVQLSQRHSGLCPFLHSFLRTFVNGVSTRILGPSVVQCLAQAAGDLSHLWTLIPCSRWVYFPIFLLVIVSQWCCHLY